MFSAVAAQTADEPVFAGAGDFDLDLPETRTLDGRTPELVYRPILRTGPTGLRPAAADEAIMLPVYRDGQICRMTTVTGFRVSVSPVRAIRCPHRPDRLKRLKF